jgi:high-affinity nickel-transport protein
MTGAMAVILAGFIVGMRHAIDPDHIAAVGAMFSRDRGAARAVLTGFSWGLGHSVTILLAGGAIVAFRIAVPPSAGIALELLVAALLILLGARNLWPARRSDSSPRALHPAVVGGIHGLAGSAAVTLLVVPAIRSPLLAIVYLAVFGAGTTLGMVLVISAMATPLGFARSRFGWSERQLAVPFGVFSICAGVFVGVQTLASAS